MTTSATDKLRSKLDESGTRTALVRGANAPPRPPETVTVAPGVSGSTGPDGRDAPLFVTGKARSGRSVREFDGRDARTAADYAAELVAEGDPQAVWLCNRAQIRTWWGRGVADMLERRLAVAARRADARLVVWTRDGGRGDGDRPGDDGASEDDAAAEDRYDVVLDP
jgi:hypothetical protein